MKPIYNLDLNLVAKDIFRNIIHKRRIKQAPKEDKLIWAALKEGKYSVKEGYRSIINS